MDIEFICPTCKTSLTRTCLNTTDLRCDSCWKIYNSYNGCYDFAQSTAEKSHYETKYTPPVAQIRRILNLAELEEEWFNKCDPERTIFYKHLPNLERKRVLLLGNGLSQRELAFLKLGAQLIYSDLSINAVTQMKEEFRGEGFESSISFHAIDAYNIPLSDESVDVILGYAFVHHLDDLDKFFNEVRRVLKVNGTCLFFDNSYSGIWQWLKFFILKPLMNYSHKKWGMSPEDIRATRKGGFKWEELEGIRAKQKFGYLIFDRFGFLYPLFKRAKVKLIPKNRHLDTLSVIVIPILFKFDVRLAAISKYFYKNTLNLVWGFRK